jgi:hypothetical protein
MLGRVRQRLKRARVSGVWLFAAVLAIGAREASAKGPAPPPGAPFEQRQVVDSLGRSVIYFVSHPATPAPLRLMIQGSFAFRRKS